MPKDAGSDTPETDALLIDMVEAAKSWAITDLARSLELRLRESEEKGENLHAKLRETEAVKFHYDAACKQIGLSEISSQPLAGAIAKLQAALATARREAQEKNSTPQDEPDSGSARSSSPTPPQSSIPARVEPLAVSEEVIQIAKEWSSIIYNEHDCPPGSKLVNYHVIVLARELLRLHEALRGSR